MKSPFFTGVLRAAPIVVGYFAVGTPFGILGAKMGLPLWAVVGMSFFIFAGASQYIALSLIASGGGLATIFFATFIINLRHFLMGMSLGPLFPRMKKRFLLCFGHSITDESYGINIATYHKEGKVDPIAAFGTNVTAHLAWTTATLLGAAAGNIIPIDLKYLAGALPIMFVTLFGLQIKKLKDVSFSLLAAFATLFLMLWLPGKWPFLTASLIVPTVAVLLKQERER